MGRGDVRAEMRKRAERRTQCQKGRPEKRTLTKKEDQDHEQDETPTTTRGAATPAIETPAAACDAVRGEDGGIRRGTLQLQLPGGHLATTEAAQRWEAMAEPHPPTPAPRICVGRHSGRTRPKAVDCKLAMPPSLSETSLRHCAQSTFPAEYRFAAPRREPAAAGPTSEKNASQQRQKAPKTSEPKMGDPTPLRSVDAL